MKLLIALCCICCWTKTNLFAAQPQAALNETDTTIAVAPVRKASFPGGIEALSNFIQQNLQYPEIALENGIQGTVVAQFIVEADGSLSNISIVKDIRGDCGKEVLRLVKMMPKWEPATIDSETVRDTIVFPVKFIHTDLAGMEDNETDRDTNTDNTEVKRTDLMIKDASMEALLKKRLKWSMKDLSTYINDRLSFGLVSFINKDQSIELSIWLDKKGELKKADMKLVRTDSNTSNAINAEQMMIFKSLSQLFTNVMQSHLTVFKTFHEDKSQKSPQLIQFLIVEAESSDK